MIAGHVRRPRPRSRALWLRLVRGLWTLPDEPARPCCGASGESQATGPRRWPCGARVALPNPRRPRARLGRRRHDRHAILHRPGLLDTGTRPARLTLAHELAHTRQHDRLGPLYLPLHVLAQRSSALLSIGRPVAFTRVHDRNPLEQAWIAIASETPPEDDPGVDVLLADFGVQAREPGRRSEDAGTPVDRGKRPEHALPRLGVRRPGASADAAQAVTACRVRA